MIKKIIVMKVCSRSTNQVFLKISQNSQENTSAGVSFFNKFLGLQLATLLNKRLQHRCFPVRFPKLLIIIFLTKHPRSTPTTPKLQPTPRMLFFLLTPKFYRSTPPTPKSRPTSFFWPIPTFYGPTPPTPSAPKFDSRQPRADAPTLPTPPTLPTLPIPPTLFSRLV